MRDILHDLVDALNAEEFEEAAQILMEALPLSSTETEEVLSRSASSLDVLRDVLNGMERALFEFWEDGGLRFNLMELIDTTSLPLYADKDLYGDLGMFSWDSRRALVCDGEEPEFWRIVPRWDLEEEE